VKYRLRAKFPANVSRWNNDAISGTIGFERKRFNAGEKSWPLRGSVGFTFSNNERVYWSAMVHYALVFLNASTRGSSRAV